MKFVTEGHSSGIETIADCCILLQNLLFGMVTELTIYFKYLKLAKCIKR